MRKPQTTLVVQGRQGLSNKATQQESWVGYRHLQRITLAPRVKKNVATEGISQAFSAV
jgi:hypothetical protein